jgi:hypothetical protein
VEAADVFVAQPLFRANEYFPKRPVFHKMREVIGEE